MGKRCSWIAIIVCATAGGAAADGAGAAHLCGRAVDRDSGLPLPGAAVVVGVSGHDAAGAVTAITGDDGRFELDAPAGAQSLTLYFADATIERAFPALAAGQAFDLHDLPIPTTAIIDDPMPYHEGVPPIALDDPPLAWSIDGGEPIVARRRDTAAILGLVAGAEPAGAVTTVDGARRLAGAPPLALGLLANASVYAGRTPVELAGGTGGAVVLDTASGTNQYTAGARTAVDTDGRGTADGFVRGFLRRDKAWWSLAGTYAGPHDAQVLARVDAAPSWAQALRLTAIHVDAPTDGAAPLIAGIATSPGARDDLADAQWTGRFDDRKLELTAGTTAERLLDAAGATTRTAARAGGLDRFALRGRHTARAGVELGVGDSPAGPTRDLTAFAGDDFWPAPDVAIDAGVRVDDRRRGDAGARAWQPHAAVSWDWTGEGRAQLFASAARSAGLDELAPASAPARDDVLAGAAAEVCLGVIGVAAHEMITAGDHRTGADAWIDHTSDGGHLDLHVAASSLDRAIAGRIALRIDDKDSMHDESLRLILDGRAAGAADRAASFVGIGLSAEHHGHDGAPSTALSAELVRDGLGTLARAVVAVTY